VTKTNSAVAYTGTDILQSVEHIIGNRNTIYDIHKSATPLPGMVLGNVVLEGAGPYEFRYTDDGNNNDVIRPGVDYGISISQLGNIKLPGLGSSGWLSLNINTGGGRDVVVFGGPSGSLIARNTTVNGGAGDDLLYGGYENSFIEGGAGNDVIHTFPKSASYADTISVGAGDIVFGGATDLVVNGALVTKITQGIDGTFRDNLGNTWQEIAGRAIINNQIMMMNGLNAPVVEKLPYVPGSLYAVYNMGTFTGTAGNDSFHIMNGGEETVLYGGSGNDRFYFYGGKASGQVVDGGNGVDTFSLSGSGNLSLDLGKGSFRFDKAGYKTGFFTNVEKIEGSVGADAQIRSSGNRNDDITFQACYGINASLGQGNDVLGVTGVWKSSSVYAGNGYDVISLSGSASAFIDGGQGDDIIGVSIPYGAPVTGTSTSTIKGGMGQDQITFGQQGISGLIFGEEGNDTISASYASTIDGGLGHDSITCGNGGDTIIWIGGSDTIDGGLGNDTVIAQITSAQVTEATKTPGGVAGWLALQGVVLSNIETVQAVAKNIMIGTAGVDNLSGGIGADTIWGLDGADTLTGAAGDTLVGGMGADVFVIAGTPVTIVDDDASAADVIQFGTGVTSITATSNGNNMTLTANNGQSVTIINQLVDDALAVGTVRLASGTVISLSTIGFTRNGTAGNDRMDGVYNRNDLLLGLGGDDTIVAYEGADTIQGGIGNDWLDGGVGNDVLTGGTGADKFSMIGASLSHDRVLDFSLIQGDRVVLATGTAYTTTDLGADIKITFGGNSVTLVGVNDFSTSMIEFG